MQLRFDDIPDDGLRIEIDGPAWLPTDEFSHSGPVSARVFLERRGQRVFLTGAISVVVVLECDRCVESFMLPQHLEFSIDLELVDKGFLNRAKGEYACKSDEMEVIYLDEPLIDIHDILAQQLLLALPVKRLCTAECRGLCSRCGINRNLQQCRCSEDKRSSPFAVLKKLKS